MIEPDSKTKWVDRGWYVITEFERTASINFQRAVELAKTSPRFTPLMDERNVLIYRNLYRAQDLLQFQQMVKLIKNWKGAKLYLKGERIEFEMLDSGIQCYIHTVLEPQFQERSSEGCRQFDPKVFPFSGCLGCRRSHVGMTWNASTLPDQLAWFAFGKVDQNGVYLVHKDELEGAALGDLFEYRSCPLFNVESLREFVQQLPGRIDPRKDREWQYNPKYRHTASRSQFQILANREPEILPVSEEAYHAYLKRKFMSV
ncbi:hypothetical protein U27_06027 [Candidatus Vecturithrix granuli]|uniref:Uncharacterized protein n=1 Tax=Vecturithrix granuli TaxID=1499967 RepID=A0A081C396_VECG1|nr:hypothetical protein U27_06027 [Candidatus Vecturithrix granuli]